MSQRCIPCAHPQRDLINELLVSGSAIRDVAGRFTLGKSGVARHKQRCLPATLLRATAARERASADVLLDRVETLIEDAQRLGKRAEASGDLRTALHGLGFVGRQLEVLLRVAGELREAAQVQVNVNVSPEWVALRTRILTALGPHPAARTDVLQALAETRDENP